MAPVARHWPQSLDHGPIGSTLAPVALPWPQWLDTGPSGSTMAPVARHWPQWLDPSSSLDDWYTQLQCTGDVSLSSIITSQRDLSRICC